MKKLWNHEKVNKMKYAIPEATRRRWLHTAFDEGKIDRPAHGQLTVSSREKADPR